MTHSFCIRYNIVDMSMETSILVSRLPVDVSADEVNYRPDIEVDERLLKFGDIVSVKIIDPQLYCYSASQYEDKRIMSIVSTIPRYANGDH